MDPATLLATLGPAVAGTALGFAGAPLVERLAAGNGRARLRRRLLAATHDRAVDATAVPAEGALFAAEVRGPVARCREQIAAQAIRLGGRAALRLIVLLAVLAGVGAGLVLRGPLGATGLDAVTGGIAAAFGMALLAVGQCRRRWRIAYLEGLSDAIDLVIRAVKSGIPVIEALRTAGREVNEPVRSEFARITEEVDLGSDLRQALRRSAARVRIPDVDFFVVCLILQRETGGQLADTLRGLTEVLRRRKELRLKMRALTAEGRMSVLIVGALPILAGFGMYGINPDYMGKLLEPGTGRTMLYAAIGSHLLGMIIAHRLTQVKP